MPALNEGFLFASRYRLITLIGKGGFSEVWEAEDTMASGLVIALKIYAPNRGLDEEGIKIFQREFALTANLQHSNLLPVRHYDIFEGSPFLILPYCRKGSLRRKLFSEGSLSEDELFKIIKEVGNALSYLHKKNILHHDIKPDNILIDDTNRYQLSDFGISRTRETISRITGKDIEGLTIAYASPELFGKIQKSTEKSDVFSFGVMLYELATGNLPWAGVGGIVLGKGAVIPQLPDHFSEPLQEIIRLCLQEKQEDRPTAAELVSMGEKNLNPSYGANKVKNLFYGKSVSDYKDSFDKNVPEDKRQLLIYLIAGLMIFLGIFLIYLLLHAALKDINLPEEIKYLTNFSVIEDSGYSKINDIQRNMFLWEIDEKFC